MFGAAIGNCDDHLRNHGFIRKDNTWELSPAFDLNPEPYDENLSDEHQLTLFGDGQVTPELLMRKDAWLYSIFPRQLQSAIQKNFAPH